METLKSIYERAAQFGRTCQSPRTGFVHLFAGDAGGDTIPLYENFCFAIALIRQKTAEGVLEGKELLERLFAFQAPEGSGWDGNFPIYLHDYPRCWSQLQPLRIAPLLVQLLRDFHHVLGEEFKKRVALVVEKLLLAAKTRREAKPFDRIWERRYLALLGQKSEECEIASSQDAAEELITNALVGMGSTRIVQLIHPRLSLFAGPSGEEAQERGEPRPTLLDWWAASTCAKGHPLQLELAALPPPAPQGELFSGEVGKWEIRQSEELGLSFAPRSSAGAKLALRLFWKGEKVHSLAIPTGDAEVEIFETEEGIEAQFELPEIESVDRNDLFEACVFCDHDPALELFVEKSKATVFQLKDTIEVRTPQKRFELSFKLIEGEGDFCGHLLRANRPFQTACKGALLYEAFDWKIGLRTLRRSKRARLSLCLNTKL